MGFFQYLLPTTWTGVVFYLVSFAIAVFLNIVLNNTLKD